MRNVKLTLALVSSALLLLVLTTLAAAQPGIITTVAGDGTAGFSGDEGPATSAMLNGPEDVAIGPDGSFYIGTDSNIIKRIRFHRPGLRCSQARP